MKFIILILIFSALMILWRLISNRYSLPCPAWLGWMVEVDNPFVKNNRAENIISHLNIRPGILIIDIGCGPRRVTIPLAKKLGAQGYITAMDIQENMLMRVKNKMEKENLHNIIFLNAGIGQGSLNKINMIMSY